MENTVITPQNEVNLEEQVKALNIEDTPTTPTNSTKPGKQESQGKHRQRGSRGGSGKKKENNNPNNNNNQPQIDYNPTALVVKNIHLGIDRDTFLQAMEELGLPKPFAFNYYYEEGAFRGLAFLNYRTPQDAQTVLTKLNGTELSGRRLKVEFKKYAPNSDKNFKPNSNVSGKESNKERDSKERDNGNNSNSNSNIKANFNLNLEDSSIRQIFDQVSQFQANFQQQECYFPNDTQLQPQLFEIIAHKLNLHYSIDSELNCVKLSKVESQRSPLAKFSRQNQLAEDIRNKKGGGNQQEKRGGRDSNNERKREKGNQTGGNNNNNNNNGGNGGNNVNSDNSGIESPRGNERRNKNRNSRLESPSTPNRENYSGRSPRNSQFLNSSNNTPDPQSPANIQTPPPTSASLLQPRDLEKSASSQGREAPFLIRNKVSPQAFTIMPIRQPKGPDLTQNFHSRKFGLNGLYVQGGNMQHPTTPPLMFN